MSDVNKNRLRDVDLDADLSVLGDDGTKPDVGRLGSAPEPNAEGGLRQAVGHDPSEAPSDGAANAGPSGSLENAKAEKDSIREVVDGYGKTGRR